MLLKIVVKQHYNMTSFFRFVKKRAIYRLGIISLTHALVHVTDFLVWSNLAASIVCDIFHKRKNINYRLPIKVYYRICTLRHIRIKIIHGSQNVLRVLTWVGGWRGIKFPNIRQPMLKLKTHSGFHDLFLK